MKKEKIKIAVSRILLISLVFSLLGCESFVRKFTRKPKKDRYKKQEMVLNPEEYKGPEMSKVELYRQYFLFWKSWQDELIAALSDRVNLNHKKQLDCAQEAMRNLAQLKALLNEQKQKELDAYLIKASEMVVSIEEDVYGAGSNGNRFSAEQLKRNILRDFSFEKVKNCLI